MNSNHLQIACNQLKKVSQWFLDAAIIPPFCTYCKTFLESRSLFCNRCLALIRPVVSTAVEINKKYSMKVFAVSDYQEPLRSLIIAKSWSDHSASIQLAQLLWNMTYIRYQPCDIMVPVPLHWVRQVRRGYNQAEIMAQHLASKKGCQVQSIIKRVKHTPFQSKLAIADRPENVKNAFAALPTAAGVAGKHIMIVDDLMTTGSTLRAMAKELIPYQPASITAVVAARVV